MNYGNFELTNSGTPCTLARIQEIERNLGRELPSDFAEFIMNTGGGIPSLNNTVLQNIRFDDGSFSDCHVGKIFGNGVLNRGALIGLDNVAIFLMSEWEISTDFLLVATSESGMHECFLMNYYHPDYAKYSILYMDTDSPEQIVEVADSFDHFLEKLAPTPTYSSNKDKTEEKNGTEGWIERARYGELSPQLQDAINATGISNFESALRFCAEKLAKSKSGFRVTACNSQWLQFVDVVYWAAQHVNPSKSLESFIGPYWDDDHWDGNEYQYKSLINKSFKYKDEHSGISSTKAMLNMWWTARSEDGLLHETSAGFMLDDDYVKSILKSIPNGPQ